MSTKIKLVDKKNNTDTCDICCDANGSLVEVHITPEAGGLSDNPIDICEYCLQDLGIAIRKRAVEKLIGLDP